MAFHILEHENYFITEHSRFYTREPQVRTIIKGNIVVLTIFMLKMVTKAVMMVLGQSLKRRKKSKHFVKNSITALHLNNSLGGLLPKENCETY